MCYLGAPRSDRRGSFIVLFLVIGAILSLPQVVQAANPKTEPTRMGPAGAVGRDAPEVVVRAVDGQPFRLRPEKRKVILLNLWATWCPPCRAEIGQLEQLQAKYAKNGLTVFGVSLDDSDEKLQSFVHAHPVGYRVGLLNDTFNSKYGAFLGYKDGRLVREDKMINATLPSFVLIGPSGRVQWLHIGSTDISELETHVRAALGSRLNPAAKGGVAQQDCPNRRSCRP